MNEIETFFLQHTKTDTPSMHVLGTYYRHMLGKTTGDQQGWPQLRSIDTLYTHRFV